MSDNKNTIADELQEEIAKVESEYTMLPTERRRKMIRWVIRQVFTVILYFFLWDAHPWVPKSLWIVAPLALLSLVSIVGYNWFLQRRLRKAKAGIERLETSLQHLKEKDLQREED